LGFFCSQRSSRSVASVEERMRNLNSTALLTQDLIVSNKTTNAPRGAERALNRTEGYVIGETDFESWDRLWKAYPGDPEVDGEEWLNFSERIQEYLRVGYENFPDEFYFWNDFSGDRTLDLKIAKPTVLTARLLSDLQEYLQVNGQKMWRIRIPIYFKLNDLHRVIVIYSDAMDIPPLCP
jgi:hypothetical protein